MRRTRRGSANLARRTLLDAISIGSPIFEDRLMLPRILEPEAMDTFEEAHDYDAMDHQQVNERFVADFLKIHGPSRGGEWIDIGTGPGRIPIMLALSDPTARVLG